MAGIRSIGVYLPIYRLPREEIARAWAGRSMAGTKAVAGYDEDAVTMAAATTLECLARRGDKADGLFLATPTAPYKEKQSAAIIASVTDLPEACHTADFTDSLRSTTIAIKAAIDAVKAGSAQNVIVAG